MDEKDTRRHVSIESSAAYLWAKRASGVRLGGILVEAMLIATGNPKRRGSLAAVLVKYSRLEQRYKSKLKN
jgi:hypothetical protein